MHTPETKMCAGMHVKMNAITDNTLHIAPLSAKQTYAAVLLILFNDIARALSTGNIFPILFKTMHHVSVSLHLHPTFYLHPEIRDFYQNFL